MTHVSSQSYCADLEPEKTLICAVIEPTVLPNYCAKPYPETLFAHQTVHMVTIWRKTCRGIFPFFDQWISHRRKTFAKIGAINRL
jgi:hypothetical protein